MAYSPFKNQTLSSLAHLLNVDLSKADSTRIPPNGIPFSLAPFLSSCDKLLIEYLYPFTSGRSFASFGVANVSDSVPRVAMELFSSGSL